MEITRSMFSASSISNAFFAESACKKMGGYLRFKETYSLKIY